MSFNLTVTDGPETKAAKTAWEENDVIYVFFKGLGEKYLKLTYNGSSWDNASGGGTLLDTDFANLSDNTLTAVYYPVPVNVTYVDYEDDTDVFLFDNSDWLVIMNYYLSDAGEAYSVDGTTVTATLSMAKPAGVALFHIAGLTKGIKDYYLSCPLVKPVACVGVRTNGSVWEEEYAEGSNMWGFADADGAIFAGRLMTAEAADYAFKLESPANTYTLSRSNRTLAAGKMYNFPALDDDDWTVTSNIDYVDLGLPSGTLWATVNIGAGSPEEYGDYFAWGETETKTTFGWGNYRHYNYDTGVYTKYSGSDYPILLAEDDAACYNWGGDCRMPTAEDWEELMNNCSLVQTKLGGVDGWQITGNGNSIFIPLGGYYEGSSIGSNGTQGFYWSSSLYTDVASATIMNLTLNNLRMSDLARFMGALVRPVKGGRAIINGHSGIDMGNGVKWATMDLGAGSSVERGDSTPGAKRPPSRNSPGAITRWHQSPIQKPTLMLMAGGISANTLLRMVLSILILKTRLLLGLRHGIISRLLTTWTVHSLTHGSLLVIILSIFLIAITSTMRPAINGEALGVYQPLWIGSG